MQFIKSIILGVIQGVTEWLPISSTAHMLLFDMFCSLDVPAEFFEMFLVVIQLFSALAVISIYHKKLFCLRLFKDKIQMRSIFALYKKIFIACVPLIILGIPIDKFLEKYLYKDGLLTSTGTFTICTMLIFYGVIFIIMEKVKNNKKNIKYKGKTIENTDQISYFDAFTIGCVQTLSCIPGTSRSGATIIGGELLHIKREVSAEFSFFLALPVMIGASILKIAKFIFFYNIKLNFELLIILILGGVSAFFVSVITINGLLNFVQKHKFILFGYYRIILGIAVALYVILT